MSDALNSFGEAGALRQGGMSLAAFDALNAGDKAQRAFQAVRASINAQALRPDPDGAAAALGHALELLAPHVSDKYWSIA